ncbi:PTS fructose IIA subunit, partial [Escherichia coli]
VVGRMRDLILQLSKSSIYSTKPRSIPVFLMGTRDIKRAKVIK